MSEAKHTPGPWEVHPGDPGVIRAAVVGVQRCTAAVAVVRYGLRSNAEAEANARLMATAPDGYELAVEILQTCDRGTGREISDITRQEIEPLRRMAAAFVARVEGKS